MQNHTDSQDQAQIVYFSHGGGPLPILGDQSHRKMVDFMVRLPGLIRKPEAIVVISAHWEEAAVALLNGENPPLLYDYYGFPREAYDIHYSAPGNPLLARKIFDLLNEQNVPVRLDPERGFDHGLYIPLKLMFPQADIPALQISLVKGLDPGVHIALGRALQELMKENILVIGSGFSFHNLREFSWQGENVPDQKNNSFQEWLIEVCTGSQESRSRQEKQLIAWQDAPFARYCHPREEHLLPLHVCVGMASGPATVIFDDLIMGKRAVAFLW